MSDGNLNIQFFANATSLLQAMDKAIRKTQEQTDNLEKMAKTSKKGMTDAEKATAAAAREMDRFAKHTKDVNRTPLEKYADEMLRLNRALKAGKIDQEDFNRAAGKAKDQFRGVADAGKSAFGKGPLADMVAYATGILSGAEALRVFGSAMQEVQQKREDAAGKQRTNAPTLARLALLAESDAHFQQLVEGAKMTFAEGGTLELSEAAISQYGLTSATFDKFRKQVSELQSTGAFGETMPVIIDSAAALRAAFGEGETGDFKSIVGKGIGASALGRGEPADLLQAAAVAGGQARTLGLSDEELLASVATVSTVAGASEAGTQMRALLKSIEADGIQKGYLKPGKTLQEQVSAIDALVAKGVDIRNVLGGRQEAIDAYRTLATPENKLQFQANMQNVLGADSRIGNVLKYANALPENAAVIAERRASNREVLVTDREGQFTNLARAVSADLKADAYQKDGMFGWVMTSIWDRMDRFTLGSEAYAKTFAKQAQPDTQASVDMVSKTWEQRDAERKAADSTTNAASKLDAAAENLLRASDVMSSNARNADNSGRQRAAAGITPE